MSYYKVGKERPTEKFDLGYVVWGDANTAMGHTTHEPHHDVLPLLTAGLIVKNDAEGVTVAMDFSAEGTFRDYRFIPRVNIREVRVVERGVCARSPQFVVFPEPPKPKKVRKRAG